MEQASGGGLVMLSVELGQRAAFCYPTSAAG